MSLVVFYMHVAVIWLLVFKKVVEASGGSSKHRIATPQVPNSVMLGTKWKAGKGQLPKGSADEGNPQEEEFISETLTDIQRGGAYKGSSHRPPKGRG